MCQIRQHAAGPQNWGPALYAALAWAVLVAACGPLPAAAATASSVESPVASASPSPTPLPTATVTPSPLPPPSATPTPVQLAAQMAADPELLAAMCSSAPEIVVKPGQRIAPILLFHHVRTAPGPGTPPPTSRYNVDAAMFEDQLRLLQMLGYESVTVDQIARAIADDAPLPDRPIAITFDDGWSEQYENAFPALLEFGFKGTFYVPSRYPEGKTTVTWDQLREMAAAGMEIGSHSRTHAHLPPLDTDLAWKEINASKAELEQELGVPVTTFAYPFGEFSAALAAQVRRAGYLAGVGLGPLVTQGPDKLWYLSRVEVRGGESLADFTRLLPWRGEGLPVCAGYQPPA